MGSLQEIPHPASGGGDGVCLKERHCDLSAHWRRSPASAGRQFTLVYPDQSGTSRGPVGEASSNISLFQLPSFLLIH